MIVLFYQTYDKIYFLLIGADKFNSGMIHSRCQSLAVNQFTLYLDKPIIQIDGHQPTIDQQRGRNVDLRCYFTGASTMFFPSKRMVCLPTMAVALSPVPFVSTTGGAPR